MPLWETGTTGEATNPGTENCAKSQRSSQFPLNDSELTTVSEADIIAACEEAPAVGDVRSRVVRVSENAVVKFDRVDEYGEARNMEFVAANTSVRVPKVIRSFAVKDRHRDRFVTYLVMQYVHGTVLRDCWLDMSEERRGEVCDKVASVIAELQKLEVERPGPIGGGRSRGPWFDSMRDVGPFNSVQELEDWYNRKLKVCKKFNKTHPDTPPFKFRKVVMSHMDISPRNIVVDSNDDIWLIDWDFAGAYPPQFERAGIWIQTEFFDFQDMMLERIEQYEEEVKQMNGIMWGLTALAS